MTLLRLFHRRPKTPQPPPQSWAAIPPATPTRRYLQESHYPLPKDEGERGRLEFQHHALELTLGNHYVTPLPPKVRTILDVGTGTGIWACDLARKFPDSIVLGLDPDTELFNKTPPDNCYLRAGDILKGLPLPDAVIDFTHQRFLVLAIPDSRWPEAVHELVRVTRPGGWVELVESDARVMNGGPATEQMFALIDVIRKEREIMGSSVFRLGEMLAGEGLKNIETQDINLKVGSWGGRAGLMIEQDILAGLQALKESCCAMGIVSPENYDQCGKKMALEWRSAHAFCTIRIGFGQRGITP